VVLGGGTRGGNSYAVLSIVVVRNMVTGGAVAMALIVSVPLKET